MKRTVRFNTPADPVAAVMSLLKAFPDMSMKDAQRHIKAQKYRGTLEELNAFMAPLNSYVTFHAVPTLGGRIMEGIAWLIVCGVGTYYDLRGK